MDVQQSAAHFQCTSASRGGRQRLIGRVIQEALVIGCLILVTAGRVAAQQGVVRPYSDSGRCRDMEMLPPLNRRGTELHDSLSRYQPESFRGFLLRTVGPLPLARATALAGFDQWRHQPVYWNQDGRGFRDRFDSRVGAEVLAHTIRFGIARAAREQTVKYRPCTSCTGFRERLVFALETPLRVETPVGSRLSGITPLSELGSAMAVTSFRPGGFSAAEGARAGLSGLASVSLMAVGREFWPWHWRPPGF